MTGAFTVLAVAVVGAASSAALAGATAPARARGDRWVAAGAGLVLVAAGAASGVPAAAVVAAVGLAAAAVVDAVSLRIPARLAIGTAVLSVGALVAQASWSSSWDLVGRAAVGTALVVLVFGGLWLAGGMGYGDVRLAVAATPSAAAAGAGAGVAVAGAFTLLWGAFVVAGVTAVVLRAAARRRRPAPVPVGAETPAALPLAARPFSGDGRRRPALAIPFGPAIAAGWLLAVVAT